MLQQRLERLAWELNDGDEVHDIPSARVELYPTYGSDARLWCRTEGSIRIHEDYAYGRYMITNYFKPHFKLTLPSGHKWIVHEGYLSYHTKTLELRLSIIEPKLT